ncbi:MAG: hypothetical protein K6F73_09050 [Lachnospiraceae bacterium]|nr:hypothetical protein [Lachnospiraceae bacterium]
MTAIALTLVMASAFGVFFRKRIIETLIPAVFAVTLTVYFFGLFTSLPIAVMICAIAAAAVFAAACLKRRTFAEFFADGWVLFILLAACVLFSALMYNRRVFYYDDLSYWGLYTKNIFALGKFPYLYENCSVDYKDYTPIIQVLQYIAQFGKKSFSEPSMFMTNVCFIYILLLPLLYGFKETETAWMKAGAVILYILFPHVLTAQFYYRLGVDIFLALVFGYCIAIVLMKKKNDAFDRLSIMLAVSFLALIKTSGIVLVVFAVLIFAVRALMMAKETGRGMVRALCDIAAAAASACVSYFSWQAFLKISWNNGYLSDRVKGGISGGTFAFPAYTGQVVRDYIVRFFTYPLTRNVIGVTAAALVVFIVSAYRLSIPEDDKKGQRAILIASMAGLAVFMAAHIGMYLFVFDEWEAKDLLEFDRYITQYLGGVFFAYACMIANTPEGPDRKRERTRGAFMAIAIAAFVVLLPYADIKQYLLPGGYEQMYQNEYAMMAENAEREWNASGIAGMGLEHDGTQRLTVFADAWDETTQFIEYCAVPQPIDRFINVPAVESGNLASFARDQIEQYVYVAENAKMSYTGDWNETCELTEDHEPLESGRLYIVIKENDDKTLRRAD